MFASFLTGTLASYEQNPAMYGTFTLINGMLGASVFFFHCTGNERVTLTHVRPLNTLNQIFQVRALLMKAYKKIIKKEKF